MQQMRIVVWDPTGEYPEGEVVTVERAAQIEQHPRCGAVLPVAPHLFDAGGMAGYARRGWGKGLALPDTLPAMVSRMAMYCTTEARHLHWRARLVPLATRAVPHDGFVRFVADAGRMGSGVTYSSPEPNKRTLELGRLDAAGGWTIGGAGHIALQQDGYGGFAIYGTARGVGIAWVAASLVPA